jgi:peptidoglycan/LPS O-acetylase OafA/YrhL
MPSTINPVDEEELKLARKAPSNFMVAGLLLVLTAIIPFICAYLDRTQFFKDPSAVIWILTGGPIICAVVALSDRSGRLSVAVSATVLGVLCVSLLLLPSEQTDGFGRHHQPLTTGRILHTTTWIATRTGPLAIPSAWH